MGISLGTFWSRGYSLISEQNQKYYFMEAKYLGDLFLAELDTMDYHSFVKKYSTKEGLRITLIAKDGEVLADSDSEGRLENHRDREEVKEALNGKGGFATRYSKTLGKTYCYSALYIENEMFSGVIRISVPVEKINLLNQSLVHSIAAVSLFCFLVALAVSYVLSRKITKPIEEITEAAEKISDGNYDIAIYTEEKNQIGRLARAFNQMTENLQETVGTLVKRNIELEAMLSSIHGAVAAIDENGIIMFYNVRFAQLTGNPGKDYLGCQIYQEIQNQAIFEGIAFAKNNQVDIMKEGVWGEKSIRIVVTPLADENKILGMLIIIEDITKIRKLENLRSDFVSNVTHELKTPLTSIRGFVDTLRNGAVEDPKVAMRFLNIIDIETERLSILIQDILLLSEIESKQTPDVESCNVNKVIQEVMELLGPKFMGEVKLVTEIQPYIRPYYCNSDRLKELLINLVDNAYKYTEKGMVKLVCKESDNELYIRVEDTGIGIEEEHLSRIFERFYRVDKSRSRKQGGTGLGLSIVKHIVELYNGRIHVESQVGKGTIFETRLPYERGESGKAGVDR